MTYLFPDSPERLLFQCGNDLCVHVDVQVEFESEALLGGILQINPGSVRHINKLQRCRYRSNYESMSLIKAPHPELEMTQRCQSFPVCYIEPSLAIMSSAALSGKTHKYDDWIQVEVIDGWK